MTGRSTPKGVFSFTCPVGFWLHLSALQLSVSFVCLQLDVHDAYKLDVFLFKTASLETEQSTSLLPPFNSRAALQHPWLRGVFHEGVFVGGATGWRAVIAASTSWRILLEAAAGQGRVRIAGFSDDVRGSIRGRRWLEMPLHTRQSSSFIFPRHHHWKPSAISSNELSGVERMAKKNPLK